MVQDEVFKRVDAIIIEMTDFKGFNFPRERLTVEGILGWLPSDMTEGDELNMARERAEQWVNPPLVMHLPDPYDSFRTRCGKHRHQFSSLRNPAGRHVMWVSGPTDTFNICAECASKD